MKVKIVVRDGSDLEFTAYAFEFDVEDSGALRVTGVNTRGLECQSHVFAANEWLRVLTTDQLKVSTTQRLARTMEDLEMKRRAAEATIEAAEAARKIAAGRGPLGRPQRWQSPALEEGQA